MAQRKFVGLAKIIENFDKVGPGVYILQNTMAGGGGMVLYYINHFFPQRGGRND